MGKNYQKSIELVISHVEGSAGNFLARLYANVDLKTQKTYRADGSLHPRVLAVGDIDDLKQALINEFDQHIVVVTHCQDCALLQQMFPAAKILQIYPYSQIGNVLYNISTKKLKTTMPNLIDNHLLHIREWFASIENRKPTQTCVDFGDLLNKDKVQRSLGIVFDTEQDNFFNRYWDSQLKYKLDIPTTPMSIRELIGHWGVENFFSSWMVAWTIFVYEKLHGLGETNRTWTIEQSFKSWQDVEAIESKYIDTAC